MDHKSCAGDYTLMCYARRIVSDAVRERYAPYLPGRRPGAWVDSFPNITITALFWKPYSGSRTSSPWRNLPAGGVRQEDTIYQVSAVGVVSGWRIQR